MPLVYVFEFRCPWRTHVTLDAFSLCALSFYSILDVLPKSLALFAIDTHNGLWQ